MLLAIPMSRVGQENPVDKATSGLRDTLKTNVRIISTTRGPVRSRRPAQGQESRSSPKIDASGHQEEPQDRASLCQGHPRSDVSLLAARRRFEAQPNHSRVVELKLNPTGSPGRRLRGPDLRG